MLSVIVHTRNEEVNLPDCLHSCCGWADEVIVADMESSDSTLTIATSMGAKILSVPIIEEFDRARNLSAEIAKNDWILYLDADERLTEEIKSTIESLIDKATSEIDAFQLPYKVISFGKWIQHSGNCWPSYKSPPLLRKGRFYFPGQVHIPAVVKGKVIRINPRTTEDAILHYSHPSIGSYFEKLNRYTTLEVTKLAQNSVNNDWQSMAENFGTVTRWYYDDTGGKQDGLAGFFLSLGSGIYELVSRMKLAESLGEHIKLPESAEQFFLQAAQAAKFAPITVTVPAWVSRLFGLIDHSITPRWLIQNEVVEDRKGSDGQIEIPITAAFISQLVGKTESHLQSIPNGSLVIAPELSISNNVREQLVSQFGQEQRLIDQDNSTYLFWWTGTSTEPSLHANLITHRHALEVLGGGELQLFETARSLREEGVLCDITIDATNRDSTARYDIEHWFSIHHETPKNRDGPRILSPIFWDRTELVNTTPKLTGLFAVAGSEQEIDSGYIVLRNERNDNKNKSSELPAAFGNKSLVSAFDRICPNADAELKGLERTTGCQLTGKIVPNAVFIEAQANPKEFIEKFGLSRFVLCVGRIEPNKNQLSLIWATRNSDIPVVFIGGAPHAEYFNLCQSFARPNVYFLGEQRRSLVISALAAASVHCLPSFGETPGLANLEAAAVGCPLIASNRGAEREYFGDNALYCDPLDPASIQTAIRESLLSTAADRATRLQKHVLAKYTWKSVATTMKQIYMEEINTWEEGRA